MLESAVPGQWAVTVAEGRVIGSVQRATSGRRVSSANTGGESLTNEKKYGMVYGMAKMTYRTTFSLDERTVLRVRELAAEWRVSQAEVIRRVVAQAEVPEKPDPLQLLDELHRDGEGLSEEQASAYLAEVRADRKQWRGR